jgi:hypothetical protein
VRTLRPLLQPEQILRSGAAVLILQALDPGLDFP